MYLVIELEKKSNHTSLYFIQLFHFELIQTEFKYHIGPNSHHKPTLKLQRSRQKPRDSKSRHGDYSALPTVVLTKVFSLLSFGDCLRASATCKHWRLSLLHDSPRLWAHHFPPLTVYLCDQQQDLASSKFKLANFAAMTSGLVLKVSSF